MDRTLADARIPDKASVELKRAVEYDLIIREGKPNPDGEAYAHVAEADTVDDATKKLCAHAFGERVYRSQLKNYDFSITNEGLDPRQRFISYKFRQGVRAVFTVYARRLTRAGPHRGARSAQDWRKHDLQDARGNLLANHGARGAAARTL